jgi:hypothetical protein
VKWLSMVEWWYNTNYHSSLKVTPFEALYGYAPPQIGLGSAPRSMNQSINELFEERQNIARLLKEQLVRAQNHMKRFADKRRTERASHTSHWVYLRLQPYRQVTVQGYSNSHKLKSKYYGLFEILKKVGSVAYKLNLPPEYLIHPVFHISQIKKVQGRCG